jgi:hypothetical protein
MNERFQNPALGDDIRLRLFTYNSNNRADINEILSVDIYFLDPQEVSDTNPDGRRLVTSIYPPDIQREEVGQYSVTFNLESPIYTIGNYIDVWSLQLETDGDTLAVTNGFVVYPSLWYTDVKPIVYDFSFNVRPNKLRRGSKRFLIIGIYPNVPKATDLVRYYENLLTISPLKIYIDMECVEGMPCEQDLRLVVDGAAVELREKCVGYYLLDTAELLCGIYNVWFEMAFGESIYISDKQQIQIF